MTNFLFLYHGGGMPDNEEDKAKSMEAWGEWMKQVGENLVDGGNPCSNIMTVDQSGTMEFSGDRITGYSVVRADDMDSAIKCAQMVPLVVDGTGTVDICETFPAM